MKNEKFTWQSILFWWKNLLSIKDANGLKAGERDLQRIKQLMEETNQVAKVGGWEVDVLKGVVTWTSVTRLIHETGPGFKPDLETGIKFYKEGHSRDTITRLVKEAIETGNEWDAELQIVTAKGNVKWIRTKGKAEFENNKCFRLFGIFQDIDDQKKMSEQLSQNELRFRAAFDSSALGMALLSADRKILDVNASLCKLTGYPEKELLALTLDKITHPGDRINDEKKFEEIVKKHSDSWQFEKRYIHKDGHIIWALAFGSCIRDTTGNIVSYVAQMQDITGTKFSQQKIQEERRLLKTIIDHLPVNIYMKDLHSRKILVNKRELEYSGATNEKDVLGKSDLDLFPAKYAKISLEEDRKVFITKKPILDEETFAVDEAGKKTWFLSSKIPFIDDQNLIKGLIGISYDITERKKREEALKSASTLADLC